MVFEWDSAKDAANQSKHGLSFALAARVFADPHRITLEDNRQNYGEPRFNTTGEVAGVIIVTVCHTPRAGVTRLISARPASRLERNRYHAQTHPQNPR